MANILAHAGTTEVSLSASSTKTVLQLATAANHRVKVTGFSIFFKGTGVTDLPILVQIMRQTDSGTMTSTPPKKNNSSDTETIQTSATSNATFEPTPGDILYRAEVHPQSGWQVIFPFAQEIIVKGSERLGLVCTLGVTPTTINCTAQFDFEE